MADFPFDVPADLKTATDDELAALIANARSTAGSYSSMGVSEASEDDITVMHELAELVTQARQELASRGAEAGHEQRVAGAFAALSDALREEDEPEADESTEDAVDPEPAKPAAKPAVAKAAPAKPRVASIAASTTPPVVPDGPEGNGGQRLGGALLAAAGFATKQMGSAVTWDEVGAQVERNLLAYGGMGKGANRQDPVAVIKIDYPEELTASAGEQGDSTKVLEYAASERRLAGASLLSNIDREAEARGLSLTAAGNIGWCAPSEILYSLCELESNDGMLDVPEVNVTRGGIKYTTGPDYRSIFAGTGYFDLTEAQVIAGTTKPCMSVACPSFTDTRLDAVGVCIQADLLSLRGYPELIARFVRGAMVAHNHMVNAKVIHSMVTGSTAIATLSTNTTTWGVDTSALTQLLALVDMAIADYKYGNRMSLSSTIEVVLPYWVQSLLRADVSRRAFYDGDNGQDQWAITQAKMNDWFRARNARVQWVYDWQDAFYWTTYPAGAAPLHQRFGDDPTNAANVVNDWPNTFQVLLYAAGTWVRGNADIITLDTVYDSTLLAQNKATQLFTEQGILVAKTCFDSRVYTLTGVTTLGVQGTGQTLAPNPFPVPTP